MQEELQRLAMMIGEEKVRSLADKCVCIVGVGGVGGYVIESLARSGIGKLILVDFDTVSLSNINRQLIALHSTVGQKKVDVWKERILDINPACVVVCHDIFYEEANQDILFEDKIDFLVDACDTMAAKKLLISKCLEKDILFLSSMGTGNKLDPSQLEITDLAKTSYDPLARILRKWAKDEKITRKIPVLCSKEQPIKTGERTPGSSAFVPSSAGLLIGSYVLRKLVDR